LEKLLSFISKVLFCKSQKPPRTWRTCPGVPAVLVPGEEPGAEAEPRAPATPWAAAPRHRARPLRHRCAPKHRRQIYANCSVCIRAIFTLLVIIKFQTVTNWTPACKGWVCSGRVPEAVLGNDRPCTLLCQTLAHKMPPRAAGPLRARAWHGRAGGLEVQGVPSGLPPPSLSCLETAASLIAT